MWALLGAVLAQLASQPAPAAVAQTPIGQDLKSGDSARRPRTPIESEPVPPLQPGPAPGQAAAGVTSYPASFFAAAQVNTAREMLDRVPGFVFDSGGDVRGLSGAQGNVLIDGLRPTSKSDDLDSIVRRIPVAQVERIDLIRGGAPGIDMQGKSVVANIIRRQGAVTSGLIAPVYAVILRDGRNVPGLRLEATRSGGGRSLEGSLVVSGFTDDGAGDGSRLQRDGTGAQVAAAKDDTRGDGTQGVATLGYETPLLGGRIRLNGQLFGQKYIFDEVVDPKTGSGIAAQREHDHQSRERGEVGARYTRDFGAKFGLELNLLQQVAGEDYLSLFSQPGETDRFREQHANSESVLRGELTWRANPDLTVRAGLEGAYNLLHSHTHYTSNGADIALPAANVVVDELRGEAFVQATWKPISTLSLDAGLRIEGSRIGSAGDVVLRKTLSYPKPRFALAWSITPADQIRLRIEREVGQLNFNDFVASSSFSTGQIVTGNPDLNPQDAWVYEAAYERTFWGKGSAAITLRHSELSDVEDRVPIFSPSGTFDAPGNIGSGSKDELITSFALPLDRLFIKGGLIRGDVTFRTSTVTDPTTGQKRSITALRPMEGNLHFVQDLPRWKLRWGADTFLGFRQRYFYFSQIETDTFLPETNLFVEYKPQPSLSLRGEIDALGNAFNRDVRFYNGVRGQVPLAFSEYRSLNYGPQLYLRMRKTF